jgi:DNA-binding cell septation regulator SpoVG
MRVTWTSFRAAPRLDAAQGLLGFASIRIDDAIAIHQIAVRRTREGRLALSFPAPVGDDGQRRPIVHPATAELHREVERQVFETLRAQGRLTKEQVHV